MGDITKLLTRWSEGDTTALTELMPLVYDELKEVAGSYLRLERAGHTLQPTALVHEAYMRLASLRDMGFNNRIHFYGAAARAMRRILVDHARRRNAVRRGEGASLVALDEALAAPATIDADLDLVALDEALQKLAAISPVRAQVVELRFFGGLSVDETAAFLRIAPATVKRHWTFARAWLHRALNPDA